MEQSEESQVLKEIIQSILEGSNKRAAIGVQRALEMDLGPKLILDEGLIAAMEEVGRRFENQEFFLPEMLVSASAMKSGLAELGPSLIEINAEPVGRVVIGTVKGDLHDIGKNLVAIMLEGNGFDVIDLGVDVPPEDFVRAVEEHHPDLLGMSALLTTTMPSIPATMEALSKAGLREKVIVMVGGAPVTQEFANMVDADLFAVNAASAATLAKSIVAD
ncbi:MAG: corrinoid protein [Anaerolineales bacterium]|nr:corrinoid protein [Anaerolineales bacterium]